MNRSHERRVRLSAVFRALQRGWHWEGMPTRSILVSPRGARLFLHRMERGYVVLRRWRSFMELSHPEP